MLILNLFEGILIGFLMAVPIGAVGILCIRRTLSSGRRQAFIVGVAGATADLLLSSISAFGIRLIYDFIKDHQYEIRLVGGVIILVMGLLLIRSRRVASVNERNIIEQSKIYFSTLAIALTNPLVVFGYAGVMTAVGAAKVFNDYWSLSALVIGVFFGSLLWFVSISNLVHRFRFAVTEDKLAIVNRIAGVLLIIIGLGSIWAGYHGMR
jgi:threonine/homoserine/homoserine lactone efflux protein